MKSIFRTPIFLWLQICKVCIESFLYNWFVERRCLPCRSARNTAYKKGSHRRRCRISGLFDFSASMETCVSIYWNSIFTSPSSNGRGRKIEHCYGGEYYGRSIKNWRLLWTTGNPWKRSWNFVDCKPEKSPPITVILSNHTHLNSEDCRGSELSTPH